MESAPKTPKSLSLPWKTRISIWISDPVLDLALKKDGTVNRCLLNLIDSKASPSSKPINGVTTHDVVVDSTRNLWFRVYLPTEYAEQDLPVMVFFHGGGYCVMSADSKTYDDYCYTLARTLPAVVVSVDYRLAPEYRHPTQHEDGFDVVKFLDNEENRSKWLPKNANISRCFFAGDSAGGNMTHHVAIRASQFKFQQLKVIGLVTIQPFFGGEERTDSEKRLDGSVPLLSTKRTDWFWNAFMPLNEPKNRDNPIINVSGPNAMDISKMELPPIMVVVGGMDILQDWQARYYQWLKKSGKEAYLVEYPNMFHGFGLHSELPESEQLLSELKDFVHKALNKI